MGLTYKSTQKDSFKDLFDIEKNDEQLVVALAGNPNTGKSTVFNSLTGLHQHTGNWPGKTVVNARGEFKYKEQEYILVDLPGTYSIFSSSVEEEVARDFICFGNPDVCVVVTDATSLERNLNLVFQVMEVYDKIVLCINLMDEARKKSIDINKETIENYLGIPVVLTSARTGEGLEELKEMVRIVANNEIVVKPKSTIYDNEIEKKVKEIEQSIENIDNKITTRWLALRILDMDKNLLKAMGKYIGQEFIDKILEENKEIMESVNKEEIRDSISTSIYKRAEILKEKAVIKKGNKSDRDVKIDNIITSKKYGIPIMLAVLALVFWITIQGANYPSEILSDFLFSFETPLLNFFNSINAPEWLSGVLVLGLYKTLAWVVSVMLPPMAIFFPLFTLLEDLGYLPRIAFNLDHMFKKACAHGKQCLTMCMGLGCNAAGVVGCRIIESPRERLIAILTNNFMPCNGRFPTLIAIAAVFFTATNSEGKSSVVQALIVSLIVIIGFVVTLIVSYVLSKTLLKGLPTSFTLELPPYRKPQIGRVLYTSLIDRTIFVLGRAVTIAAPAGALTWILGNVYIGDMSIIAHMAAFLEPIAHLIGLDGFILMAFILGLPANEIVLPILLMAYLATGSMVEFDSIDSLRQILLDHGWTYLTALNVMLFSLLHWPCATTLMTIKKETGSKKWTIISAIMPTAIAFGVCFITTTIYRLLFG